MDDIAQEMPAYTDETQERVDTEIARGTNTRKRSGKLSREGERRKKRAWRARNTGRYRAYMRAYMALRRANTCSHEHALRSHA